jgi:integrase
MAIGVAAQFELLLRQKDIIGDWGGARGQKWTGYFTWENIPGWRWRMKTSKSKYRAAAQFDLASYSLLLPLLEAVPHEQRTGAIVKGEHGLPVRERSYRKWFRQIARAAGIPDAVWSMDSRAGGATEAEEAGAEIDAIQGALTHSKKDTTLRYIRRSSKKIADVAEARNRKRTADDGGTR